MTSREPTSTTTTDSCNSREVLFGQAVQCYLGEALRCIDDMSTAVRRRDSSGLARAAHVLAGNSAVLGAQGLAERCYEIEDLAHSGDFETCSERLPTIMDAYRRVELDLRATA